jgi:hypothetical protein
MSFSTSPAPARRRYIAPGATPPPARRGRGPSRLVSPRPGATGRADDAAMDVDGTPHSAYSPFPRQEVVFAKSDELSSVFYTQLPEEVKAALRNAGGSGFNAPPGHATTVYTNMGSRFL